MEDILDVYQRPHDPECPMVCVTRLRSNLIAETRVPIAAKPGRAARIRLRIPAQRHGQPVHDVRAVGRLAACQGNRSPYRAGLCPGAQELSDTHFPNAKKIVLVQDNLNTHKPASLYGAFPPAEARRLVERFECTTRPNMELAGYG